MDYTQEKSDWLFNSLPFPTLLVQHQSNSAIGNKAALSSLSLPANSLINLDNHFPKGITDEDDAKCIEVKRADGETFRAILFTGKTRPVSHQTKIVNFVDISSVFVSSVQSADLKQIAHDINNPLTVIAVNANWLANGSLDEANILKLTQKIIDATNRCADNVRKLGVLAES